MNLDQLEKSSAKSDGKFLSLKGHGDKVVLAFLGDYHEETVWWGPGGQKAEPNAPDAKPSKRFSVNAYVPAENAIKVFTFNKTCASSILPALRKYGTDWTFEITRMGEPKSPQATFSVLPEKQLTAEDKAKIASLELHELAA